MSALVLERFTEDVEVVLSSFKTPPPRKTNKRRKFAPHAPLEEQPNDDTNKSSESWSIGLSDYCWENCDLTHDVHSPLSFQQDDANENETEMRKSCDSIETLVMTFAETLEEDSLFFPVDEAKQDDDKNDDELFGITEEDQIWKRVCRSKSPMFGSPNNRTTVAYCSSPGY